MRRRPDNVPLEEIVYLDEDLHTYKYFMTGKFDEEARKKELIASQAEAQRLLNWGQSSNSSQDRDASNEKDKDKDNT